jgi:nitrogen-specific signal transduction histidine kinase
MAGDKNDLFDTKNSNISKLTEVRFFEYNEEMVDLDSHTILVCDGDSLLYFPIGGAVNTEPKFVSNDEKNMVLLLMKTVWGTAKKKLTSTNNDFNSNEEKVQKEFINICAHELRAPLHPIMLQADLLKKKIHDANHYSMVESIYNNAQRMERIIDDLMEMARIDSDLVNLSMEKFSLNDLVEDLVVYYNKIILSTSKKYADLKVDYSNDNNVFFVEADRDRIQQTLVNIINNSIKFSGQGKISIRLSADRGTHVLISVRDTGPGIGDEVGPRLFRKFMTTSSKGLGLGLYISKNIINLHHGEIWAQNNRNGSGGCTFFIRLPITIIKKTTDSLNILIIDGDPIFVSLLKGCLSNIGYNVETVSDLTNLNMSYVYGYYSMIIVDYSFEDDAGTDAIKKIILKEKIKICYLTKGKTNYESFSTLYGIGKDDLFVSKALKPESIAKKIDIFIKT